MTFSTKAIGTLGLALFAVIGNIINLPLFFGVHFLFGSVAVMLAVRLIGLWPAILVALAGGTYTWILWGHPYAMLTFTLEAVTVSLLYQRGVKNLVLADLAFWLVAGATLAPVVYMGVLGMDMSSAIMITLKQSLNGLFNALIAGLLVKILIWRFHDSLNWLPSHFELRDLLFHVLLTLALVAGSVPLIVDSYDEKTEQEKRLASVLDRVLTTIEERLQEQSNDLQVFEAELQHFEYTGAISGIALISAQGNVIAQAGEVTAPSSGATHALANVATNLQVWLPESSGSLVNRWKDGVYQYRLPVTGLPEGRELIAYKSAEQLVQAVENQRNESFAFLAAMTLLSILISSLLSRVLTQPLIKLDKASKHLPEKIRRREQPVLPKSRIDEYNILSNSLQTMSNTLTQTFAELDNARAGLEQEVEARTRELANTSTMLRNVLEASTELAIIATDTEGTVSLFNTGAENLLGYDSSEVIDKQSLTLFHLSSEIEERSLDLSNTFGEVISGFDVLVKNVEHQGSESREWSYLTKQGVLIPVMLTATPILDNCDELTGFLGIAQDITERKRIEKMKNEFISTVSHELRTPLTSVSGALSLALSGKLGDIPEKATKLLNTAHRNSERLAHLINDLLDIEKITAGQTNFDMQVQPIMPILEQAVEENQDYGTKRRVQLALTSELTQERVKFDKQRLIQVMANLLSNAIKYSPDDCTVTVQATSNNTEVTVSVIDKGPGIPDDFQSEIFQRFAQADSSDTRQKGGTGLGLAITQELLTRMGGTIGFDTTEGEGTCFYFKLPSIAPVAKIPLAPFSKNTDASTIESPRILVVEDDPDVARLLEIMLESAGYRVNICHTGAEALESVKAGSCDLISLDLALPDVDGLDIIRQMKT